MKDAAESKPKLDSKQPQSKLDSIDMEMIFEIIDEQVRQAEAIQSGLASGYHGYLSVIRFCGHPILPPLMTQRVRDQMAMYKRQAMIVESRWRARSRQKLLARVQTVMAQIEQRHTPTPTPEDIPLDELGSHSASGTDTNTHSHLHQQSVRKEPSQGVVLKETPAENDSGISGHHPVTNEDTVDTMADVTDLDSEDGIPRLPLDTLTGETSDIQAVSAADSGMVQSDEMSTPRDIPLESLSDITPVSTIVDDQQADHFTVNMVNTLVMDNVMKVNSISDLSDDPGTQTNMNSDPQNVGSTHCTNSNIPLHLRAVNKRLSSVKTSLLSTSSSGTTASSEEMNRTVIEKDEDSFNGFEDSLELPWQPELDWEKPKQALLKHDLESEGQVGVAPVSRPGLEGPRGLGADSGEETDPLRASLLSKVDFMEEDSEDSQHISSQLTEIDTDLNSPRVDKHTQCSDSRPMNEYHNELLQGWVSRGQNTTTNTITQITGNTVNTQTSNTETSCHPQVAADRGETTVSKVTEHGVDDNVMTQVTGETGVSHTSKVNQPYEVYKPPVVSVASQPQVSHTCTERGFATRLAGNSRGKMAENSPPEELKSDGRFSQSDSESHSELYTASTELGPYMATSLGTTNDTLTTLPHLPDVNDSGSTNNAGLTSYTDSLDTVPQSKAQVGDEDTPSSVRIRRDSYTLDQPSPALIANTLEKEAKEKKSPDAKNHKQGQSKTAACPQVTKSEPAAHVMVDRVTRPATHPSAACDRATEYSLTTSMEDLQIRPVQRKLDYEEDKVQNLPSEYTVPKPQRITNQASVTENCNSVEFEISQKPPQDPAIMSQGQRPQVPSHEDYIQNHMSHAGREQYMSQEGTGPAQDPSDLVVEPPQDLSHVGTEREGKEEHLQRYLAQLSQMPLTSPSTTPSTGSDPQSGDSHGKQKYVDPSLGISPSLGNPKIYQQQQIPQGPMVPQVPQQYGYQDNLTLDADLLALQAQQFELMRQQMLAQQQQQLATLLAEQERQQLAMQQEMLTQQMALFESSKPAKKGAKTTKKVTGPEKLQAVQEFLVSKDSDVAQITYSQTEDFRPYTAPPPKVTFDPSLTSCHDYQSADDSLRREGHHGNVETSSPAVLRSEQMHPHPDMASPSPRFRHMVSKHVNSPEDLSRIAVRLDLRSIPAECHKNFERLSAGVKGYLTRRLIKTEKVQQIIKTIKDTAEFAVNFISESPIKKGIYSAQDQNLQGRVLAQLTAAMYEIHEIFFEISTKERMNIISQSRALERERMIKAQAQSRPSSRVSTATLKAQERRRKAAAVEATLFGDHRPKSAPPPRTSSPRQQRAMDISGPIRRNFQFLMNRALKPQQALISPIKPVKDNLNRAVAQKNASANKKTVVTKTTNAARQNITNVQSGKVVKKASTAVRNTTVKTRKVAEKKTLQEKKPNTKS